MRMNEIDRITLKLLLEQLNSISPEACPELRVVKDFISQVLNITSNSPRELLDYLSGTNLIECIHAKIRRPLLEIYKARPKNLVNHAFHNILYSVLMALATYWPLNDITIVVRSETWRMARTICPLSGHLVRTDNIMKLMSGHVVDKEKYIATRSTINQLRIFTHPCVPGLLDSQDYEYNFNAGYNVDDAYTTIKEDLKLKYPFHNLFSLKEIVKLSIIPTAISVIASVLIGACLVGLSLFPAIPVTIAVAALSIGSGLACGTMIGFVKNKLASNRIELEYKQSIKENLHQQQARIINSNNFINNFVNTIHATRIQQFNQLREANELAISSSHLITRLLQFFITNNSVDDTRHQSAPYAEMTNITLSVINPLQSNLQSSEQIIPIYLPTFRRLA